MRKLVTALACLGTALVLAGAAAADLRVGVNDDGGKYETGASWFYPTLASTGLGVNAVTLRWDETAIDPIGAVEQALIEEVIAKARASGVAVELDIYPLHSQALTLGARCPAAAEPGVVRQHRADPAVRRVGGLRRADVPERARVRRHERVQPAAVHEPAVGRIRPEPVRRDLRPGARSRLRRAQGREQRHPGLGRRPLAARERQAERAQQLLDDARHVPERSREVVAGIS